MKFENPQPAEDINVSPRNHIVDFLVLTVGTLVAIAVITFVIGLLSGYLAKRIPFEMELSFSQPFEQLESDVNTDLNEYLTGLVNSIAQCSDLPDGMEIKYHYQGNEMVNAFATLGGNIILFQGLLDELDNENQLAMIIAHEIAHIKRRHPIQAIGRAVIVGISFSMLMGNNITNPLEQAGLLTMLNFSRGMETEADEWALVALQKCYGHINGAAAVFKKFETYQQQHHINPPPFLSTHPLNKNRINKIEQLAKDNGWQTDGKLIAFPAFISAEEDRDVIQ
jgi:predicted Zn-dependent protease